MNASLRGHQFVKEGAEEVLKLITLSTVQSGLLFRSINCGGNRFLFLN